MTYTIETRGGVVAVLGDLEAAIVYADMEAIVTGERVEVLNDRAEVLYVPFEEKTCEN